MLFPLVEYVVAEAAQRPDEAYVKDVDGAEVMQRDHSGAFG
jgi:hypothetical protein